jgi:plasmid maintenance system killer protein
MNIVFRSSKDQKLFNNDKKLVKTFGPEAAKRIRKRLDQLRGATVLEDLRNAPGRLHQLSGDRAEQFSLDLVHPYRLLFEAANDPIPRKPDSGLDWTQVTAVRIIEVEDTHG